MSNKVFNILIAGIGGQGGLTLSRILAEAAVKTGFSVKTGETLGMAQRYGSVVSFVRIGGNTYSPIFGSGEADVLLGLELTETVRNMRYLRHHGSIIVADEYRPPSMASITGRAPSRSVLLAELARYNAVVVPARKIAVEAGNPRALNMVLLGVLNAATNILPHHVVEDTIRSIIRGEAGEKSVRAYYEGHKWFKNHR